MSSQKTLNDVARQAGVSRATVSLVCRNSPLVAQETRQRVEDAMAAVGYVYHRGAANLRSSRSLLVGLVLPDLANPVFAELVGGVEAALHASGRHVFVAHSGESPQRQAELLQHMLEMRVDGLIISAATGTAPDALQAYRLSGTPVVQVLRRFDATGLDYAGTDNRDGMRRATEHLLALGHRRIAFLGSAVATSVSRERQQGHADALQAAGLVPDAACVLACTPDLDDAARATQALLDLPQPPTAVACFSDVIAFGATLGLYRRGVEPGRAVSVIGFDDIPWAQSWRPALSSMAIAPRQIGEAAARLLQRRWDTPDAPVQAAIGAAVLVQRASTAAPLSTHGAP